MGSGSAYAGHEGLHKLGKARQWRCAYCHRVTHCKTCQPELHGRWAATRDHKLPRSRGGRNTHGNIALACFECNQAKGASLLAPAQYLIGDLPDTWAPPPPKPRKQQGRPSSRRTVSGVTWRACAEGWHKTQQQADNSARALLAAIGREFGSYRCPYCEHWHLTRIPAEEPLVVELNLDAGLNRGESAAG